MKATTATIGQLLRLAVTAVRGSRTIGTPTPGRRTAAAVRYDFEQLCVNARTSAAGADAWPERAAR